MHGAALGSDSGGLKWTARFGSWWLRTTATQSENFTSLYSKYSQSIIERGFFFFSVVL
jgi:hemolysin activation/secretion protein